MVNIRRATGDDTAILAHHRFGMFRDMGALADELVGPLIEACKAYFPAAIENGEYVGWVAENDEGEIVAGAGLQLRRILPRPDGTRPIHGSQAIILNVYTEPAWRRRGIANELMKHVLDWIRENKIESVVLHAAPAARSLYEKLGFIPTNEMRLAADHLLTD